MAPRRADMTVEIVEPAEADYKVQVVGDQVLQVTPADVGQVVTVQPDGTLGLEPATGGTSLPDGGATGEVLTKQSATDGDAAWEPSLAGRIGTTLGLTSIDGDDLVIDVDTPWGIADGIPYFDEDGPTPGEEALLILDPDGSIGWVLLTEVS